MNLDVKLKSVPPTHEILTESIRDITTSHQNKFVIIFGTVVRTGNVHSRELRKLFKCKQCEKEVECYSDITEYNKFIMPVMCDGKVDTKKNPFF